MSRRDARERAFQLLFQLSAQSGDEDQQIGEFFANIGEYSESERKIRYSEEDLAYIREIAAFFRFHKDDLDSAFVPFLKDWTRERLPKVDLAILRLAAAEILYKPEIPLNVTINEAVLLAKRYGTRESRSYINGVLAQLEKPAEASTAAETEDFAKPENSEDSPVPESTEESGSAELAAETRPAVNEEN